MKTITFNLKCLSLFIFGAASMTAQMKQTPPQTLKDPNGFVKCYSVENEHFLKQQFPNRSSVQDFESWLAPKIAKIKADRASGKNVQAVYNIPVVIHIIHDGDAVGSGENITDAQAISQINVLNNDYRRLAGTPGGANTTGLAVDCEINFMIARTDPNGNPTTGIVRHNLPPKSNNVTDLVVGQPDWETREDVEMVKAETIWDSSRYLNMWTVRFGGNPTNHATEPGMQGILGYAQFPDNPMGLAGLATTERAANTDGVVASFDAFGTMAENDGTFILNSFTDGGRTMTHEVGHWLGLRHIWGDAQTVAQQCVVDDFCADTPMAAKPNFTCNLNSNTCPTKSGNDMVQNYMDYTNDACMDTFTQNQKDRMVAVMTYSTRRFSLHASPVSSIPTPYIQFANPMGYVAPKTTLSEGTGCNYTDVTIPLTIIKAPSAAATVTFNVVAGGTAVNGVDYQLVNPTVTFPTGSNTAQNLTVRIFNDGIAETNETFSISLSLNANGGDALLNNAASTIQITIVDNDKAPTTTKTIELLNENFETAAGWTVKDEDGDGKNWDLIDGADGIGTAPNTLSGRCAFSQKDLTIIGDSTAGSANPNDFYISPKITIPTGITAANLSYIVAGFGGTAGDYTVYFTQNVSSAATILAGTVLQPASTIGSNASVLRNNNLLPFAGQTGYIVFRHSNNNAATGLLLLDTVIVNYTVNTNAQTVVNTPTKYEAVINTTGNVYTSDKANGNMMIDITNSTNFDYGCTSVNVSRDQATAGAAAVNYGTNTANNLKVMAKSFTVATANNNPTGNATLKFYFTEAEIAAWETATGNNRSALKVIKQGDSSVLATTLATFGTNTTLTANVANGVGGVYYFGVTNTLDSNEFEFENFSLFPNPNTGTFNVKFTTENTEDVNILVTDMRGRKVFEKAYANNAFFNQEINLSNVSSGVYFVSISDGKNKTVRKIVVE